MADGQPCKTDIESIFRRLRAVPTNKVCFDCTAKNPTWASVTYGVFICIDCSAVHRNLGVHVTFVRSTQLDTNWTWLQLRLMQLGGNANAESFFQQHNCTSKDAQQKYNSRAAQLYKEKLLTAATEAMTLHGIGKLHLDIDLEALPKVDSKEIDFFEQHNSFQTNSEYYDETRNGSLIKLSQEEKNEDEGPSVDAVLYDSEGKQNSHQKLIIGARKPVPKKLGGKKGGLGAQRVKTNFADIEKEAELADKLKFQEKKIDQELTAEEEEAQITSMRLAYEDLSLKQKQEEEKIKAVDPMKALQLERLGMGVASRIEISHSALNDMRTIAQESPVKPSKTQIDRRGSDDFFDDFVFSSSTNSSFSMYKSPESRSPTSVRGDSNENHRNTKQPSFWMEQAPKQSNMDKKLTLSSHTSSNEAQKKFATAKAISSDQFFSDSSDASWERKSNLSRFEGSSSISSAEYFGRNETPYGRGVMAPDLEDVKESVRQGVTKVAGKLSSLANGVMSTIQDKYGF